MNRYYAIVVLFAFGVGVLTWLRMKNENNPVISSGLHRAFPRFITFLAAGTAILAGVIFLMDRYEISKKFWWIPFMLLVLILGVPAYSVVRGLEPKGRGRIDRQLRVLLLVFTLSVALYGLVLIGGMLPIVLTGLSIIAAVGFIVLIEWSRWKK